MSGRRNKEYGCIGGEKRGREKGDGKAVFLVSDSLQEVERGKKEE